MIPSNGRGMLSETMMGMQRLATASKRRQEVGVSPAGWRQNWDERIPLIDCDRPVEFGKPSSIITSGSFCSMFHSFSRTKPPCK